MTTTAKGQLRHIAVGGIYVLSIGAVYRGLGILFGNPMTASMLGGAIMMLVAARAGLEAEEFGPRARKRMLWGVGAAVVVVIAGTLTSIATGGHLEVAGISSAAFYGIAESAAIGFGHEIWLRGIPLHFARRAGVRERWSFAFVVLAGAAAVVLEPRATPMGIVVTAASSAAFAAMWLRGRDSYAPVAAHIAWVWLADALLEGDLLRLVERHGELTSRHAASGAPALAATLAFVFVAFAILSNKIPLRAIAAQDPEEKKA